MHPVQSASRHLRGFAFLLIPELLFVAFRLERRFGALAESSPGKAIATRFSPTELIRYCPEPALSRYPEFFAFVSVKVQFLACRRPARRAASLSVFASTVSFSSRLGRFKTIEVRGDGRKLLIALGRLGCRKLLDIR